MSDKIKISEKEFYEKLCLDCGGQHGKECGYYPNCFREKAAKRFVEVTLEKTALEKAREFSNSICGFMDITNCHVTYYKNFMALGSLYEHAIQELQDKLNEKNN